MSQDIKYAGEFNLDTLRLYSSNEIFIDIANLVISIDLNENIFQSSVTGNIVVGDANNLLEKLPITGQEYLDLKISTPGAIHSEDTINFTGDKSLYVYDVVVRAPISSGSQVYTLSVSTIEPLRNQNIKISKSYTKSVSGIVNDIFKNTFKTSKKLFIEKTKGIRKIVSPNSHPFTLINRLKREAKSAKYNSPHYLFFENKNGFHFRTLQDLINQPVKMIFHSGDKNLDENRSNSNYLEDTTIGQSFRRIKDFTFASLNNWYDSNQTGMLGSTLITHDIYTKSYTKKTFDYISNFDNYGRVGNKPIYNATALRQDFGTFENSRLFIHPVSRVGTNINDKDAQYYKDGKSQYDNSVPEDCISDRASKISELNSGISINMSVHGHTGITAGDMVDIRFPIVGEDHDNEIIEKTTSGNYLISHLRHNFILATSQHNITLRAVKDGKGG